MSKAIVSIFIILIILTFIGLNWELHKLDKQMDSTVEECKQLIEEAKKKEAEINQMQEEIRLKIEEGKQRLESFKKEVEPVSPPNFAVEE